MAAAPTAAPMKPISAIGVSRTRSGPNSSSNPSEVLNGPPATATSSPNVTTSGFSRISSPMAAAMAWFMRIRATACSSVDRSLRG